MMLGHSLLAGCITGKFRILSIDSAGISANSPRRAYIFISSSERGCLSRGPVSSPPRARGAPQSPHSRRRAAAAVVAAAAAAVVCLTCRILVPVKSVFLLLKASPRPNSEAVGRSVGRSFGNGNRKLRFRAKKWARTGHACSRTGTGTDWEGALLEA